jgi:hypothetical protein
LIGKVIEGRPSVVGEVAEDEAPFGRRQFEEPGFEQILLGRTRLVLAKDFIGLAVEPGADPGVQRLRVGVRPVVLQPEAVARWYGDGIRLG